MFDIQKQKNRITSLALAILICSVNAGSVTVTNAYYSNKETSGLNTFRATSLDLVIGKEQSLESFQLFGATTTSPVVTVSDNGETPFNYRTSSVVTACNAQFLADTTMTVKRNGAVAYRGSITGFTLDTLDTVGTWEFAFLLNPHSTTPQDALCKFKIHFLGWDKSFSSPGLGGYSDSEDFTIALTASGVVLNEILANPEGPDGLSRPFGEWVELYNNSSSNVNLAGWTIHDADGNIIPINGAHNAFGRTSIFARGSAFFTDWLVVFMNKEVLNNTGEAVYLYDNLGRVRDMYAYGNKSTDANFLSHITPGYNNNSGIVGTETAGNEGKSDARIPDGYGVWVDPIPTPGGPNTMTDQSVVVAEPVVVLENVATTSASSTITIHTSGGGGGSTTTASSTIDTHHVESSVGESPVEKTTDVTIQNPTAEAVKEQVVPATEVVVVVENVQPQQEVVPTPVIPPASVTPPVPEVPIQ